MPAMGGEEGDSGSLPFARSAATVSFLLDGLAMGERGKGVEGLTPIQMRLLGYIIVRVAVRVDRAVQLFECHEGLHQLVVGVQQTA
jgi:hypothetical protein